MKNAFKTTLSALAIVAMTAVSASAATLTGVFNVTVVNKTGVNSAQSAATLANFNSAFGVVGTDTFTYDGALDFSTFGANTTTIAQWLADNPLGTVTGLDTTVGNLPLSGPNIDDGNATTTFFLFERVLASALDFTVTHDDGFAIIDDGVEIGGFSAPTEVRTTSVNGLFNGGNFGLLYVATNGNPSVLNVSAVPLPAGGILLLTALGGIAALRRRKAA